MSSGSDPDTIWLQTIKALREEVEKDILAMTDLTKNEIKAIKKKMEATTDNNGNDEENTLEAVVEQEKTASDNNETDIKLTETMNVKSSRQEPESDSEYSFKFNKDMKEETDDKHKHGDLKNITKETSTQSENEDSEIAIIVNELASEASSTAVLPGNEIAIETVDNLKELSDNKLVEAKYEGTHSGETQELNKKNNTVEKKEDENREREKIGKDNVKNEEGGNDQQCDSGHVKPSVEKEIINRETDSDTMKKDTTTNDQLNITDDQIGTERSTEVTVDVKNIREINSNYKNESTGEISKNGSITSLVGNENTNNEKVTEDTNILSEAEPNTNTDNVKENDGTNNERFCKTKHNYDNTKQETLISEVIVIDDDDDDEMEIVEHSDDDDCVFMSEIKQGSNNETLNETNSDDSKSQNSKMTTEINIQATYSEPPDSPKIVGGEIEMNSSEIIKEHNEGRKPIESNETIGEEDKKKVTNECQKKELSVTETEEECNGEKRPKTMNMEPNTDKEKAVKQIEDDNNSEAKIKIEGKLNKKNSENKTEETEITKESSEPQKEQQIIPDEGLQDSNKNKDQNTLKLININEIINQTNAENEPNKANEAYKENEKNTDKKNESDEESEQNKDNNGDQTNESVEENEPDEKKTTDDEKESDEDNSSDKNNETENENEPNDENDKTNEKEPECFKFKDGIISLEEDYGLDSKDISKTDVMEDKDGDDADVTQYSIIIINNEPPTTENIETPQITVRQYENVNIDQVMAAKKFYLKNIKNIKKQRKNKFARNILKTKLQMIEGELEKLIKCYKTRFENGEPSHSSHDAEPDMDDGESKNHESEIEEKQNNSSDKGEHLPTAREEKECLEQSETESESRCTSEENENSKQSTEQEEFSIEKSAIEDKHNHASDEDKEPPLTKDETENPESTDNVDKEIKQGNELKIGNEGCITSNEAVADNINANQQNLHIEKKITGLPTGNLVTGQGDTSAKRKETPQTQEKGVQSEFLSDTPSSLSGSEEYHDALDYIEEEKLKEKDTSMILKSAAKLLSPLADLFQPLPGPSGIKTMKNQKETKSEKQIPALINKATMMSDEETEGEYEEGMEFDTADNMEREKEKQNEETVVGSLFGEDRQHWLHLRCSWSAYDATVSSTSFSRLSHRPRRCSQCRPSSPKNNEEEKDKKEDTKKNARKNEDLDDENPPKKIKLDE